MIFESFHMEFSLESLKQGGVAVLIATVMAAAALLLALVTVLTPAAGAITVEEARDLLRESYVDPIDEEILALPTIQEITDAWAIPTPTT